MLLKDYIKTLPSNDQKEFLSYYKFMRQALKTGRSSFYFAMTDFGPRDEEDVFKKYFKPNLIDEHGETLLTSTAASGHLNNVKHLIAHGCDINQQNAQGKTPLMAAVVNNKIMVAKYLVQKGAKINVKDNNGYTVMDYVNMLGNERIQKAFSKK